MKKRLFVLDVFRGLAVFIMVLVDAPPGDAIYPIFKHAPWEGLTIADFAFPFFVFAMGMSAALAKAFPLNKVLFRSAKLFLIGLIFNLILEILSSLVTDEGLNLSQFRILGILQRLALTFLLGVMIVKLLKTNVKILIAAFSLMLISSVLSHLYCPENPFAIENNINLAVDLKILGANHLFRYGDPLFDPENLFGTINSASSMLFAFITCKILIENLSVPSKLFRKLASFALALFLCGLLWCHFDIVSKSLWTAPFSLFTSAICIVVLIFLYFIEDSAKTLLKPLAAFGMNALPLFLATNLTLLILIYAFTIEDTPLYLWVWLHTVYGFISPAFSALLYSLLWTSLWTIFNYKFLMRNS